jgi:hypothetical protein
MKDLFDTVREEHWFMTKTLIFQLVWTLILTILLSCSDDRFFWIKQPSINLNKHF